MDLSYIWPYTVYKISEKYRRYKGTSTVVKTSYGPIQGLEVTSQFGYKYAGFQGVPYGNAPIGELRFKVSKIAYSKQTNIHSSVQDDWCIY